MALHLVQLASPLRLDTDSAQYLGIAASIADGTGASPHGYADFPPGYPSLVAALDVAGLGSSWALVALNLAFLALGGCASFVALRVGLGLGVGEAQVVVALTLLAVTVVKYAALPTSEIVFFGVSATSVALLCVARSTGARKALVAGIVVAAVACTVRTAGVALAPAVVLAFQSVRGRVVAASATLVVALSVALVTPRYLSEFGEGWNGVGSVVRELVDLARDLGAVSANVPTSGIGEASPLLVVVGLIIVAMIGLVVRARITVLGPADGTLIGVVALAFVWPSDHQRFLLLAIPFLLGYAVLLRRRAPRLGAVVAAVFATVGLAALVYSTTLTFSGDAFPERYAGGTLAPSYRVAWGLSRAGDRRAAEPPVVVALERYDPDPPAASRNER